MKTLSDIYIDDAITEAQQHQKHQMCQLQAL